MNFLFNIFNKEKFGFGWVGNEKEAKDERNYLASEIFKTFPSPKWENKKSDFWRKFEPIRNQSTSLSCFPPNALVLMEDLTVKPISEIREGESVITHKGRARRVIKKFKRKWQGKMIRIIPYGFNEGIEATLEHPFYVYRNGNFCWVRADEITTNDYLVSPIFSEIKDKTIYSFERDPNFLWLLGVYLAEGHITETYSGTAIHFTIGSHEEEFKNKIISSIEKLGQKPFIGKSQKRKSVIDIGFCNPFFVQLFKELGGKCAENKRIHPRLMYLEPELQMCIFNGWFMGDGCFFKKKKRYIGVTISKNLAFQLRTIALRNGIIPYIKRQKEKIDKNGVRHKEAYYIEFNFDKSQYTKTGIKNTRFLLKDGYVCFKVRKIVFPHREIWDKKKNRMRKILCTSNVYNLEVEEDNSYIVYGFAVHNCVAQSLALGLGVENYLEEKRFEVLSPRFIYSRGYIPHDGGMYYLTALEIARKEGCCLEQQMPSDNKTEEEMRKRDDETNNMKWVAQIYKNQSYVFLPLDIDVWAGFLQSTNKTILAGTRFNKGGYKSFNVDLDKNGEYGHAIVITDAVLWNNKKTLIFQNSWGKRWGINGLGVITEDQFKKGVVLGAYLVDFKYQEQKISKPHFVINSTMLNMNSSGSEVVKLQVGLQWLGFFPSDTECTGFYGGLTRQAVRDFQKNNNLPVTGIADLNTIKVFNEFFGRS